MSQYVTREHYVYAWYFSQQIDPIMRMAAPCVTDRKNIIGYDEQHDSIIVNCYAGSPVEMHMSWRRGEWLVYLNHTGEYQIMTDAAFRARYKQIRK